MKRKLQVRIGDMNKILAGTIRVKILQCQNTICIAPTLSTVAASNLLSKQFQIRRALYRQSRYIDRIQRLLQLQTVGYINLFLFALVQLPVEVEDKIGRAHV